MDWKSYVSSDQGKDVEDDLASNRKGGGYLEKKDFLMRVEERKNDVLEGSQASKRRRT
jgi:hypothetical protein